MTNTKTRYQRVLNTHQLAKKAVTEKMGITADEYYNKEFEQGINLLDLFFNDTPDAHRLKKMLATEKPLGYWPFFRNARRQAEAVFWNEYQDIYHDQLTVYPEPVAAAYLREEWQCAMNEFNNDMQTHEKLRHHILQLKTLIL